MTVKLGIVEDYKKKLKKKITSDYTYFKTEAEKKMEEMKSNTHFGR